MQMQALNFRKEKFVVAQNAEAKFNTVFIKETPGSPLPVGKPIPNGTVLVELHRTADESPLAKLAIKFLRRCASLVYHLARAPPVRCQALGMSQEVADVRRTCSVQWHSMFSVYAIHYRRRLRRLLGAPRNCCEVPRTMFSRKC